MPTLPTSKSTLHRRQRPLSRAIPPSIGPFSEREKGKERRERGSSSCVRADGSKRQRKEEESCQPAPACVSARGGLVVGQGWPASLRVEGQGQLDTGELLGTIAQDNLDAVVTISQPGGQLYDGQVELTGWQGVGALRRETEAKALAHSSSRLTPPLASPAPKFKPTEG